MIHSKRIVTILMPALVLAFCLTAWSDPQSPESRLLRDRKAVVERYFHEVTDGLGVGDAPPDEWNAIADEVGDVMDELFAEDAIQHFPGLPPDNPRSLLNLIRAGIVYSMETEIHSIMAEGDMVAVRVSHVLTPKPAGVFPRPRVGCLVPVNGEPVLWDANVFLRFEDRKIVEEWVARDDLGILLQISDITVDPCIPYPAP